MVVDMSGRLPPGQYAVSLARKRMAATVFLPSTRAGYCW
jgi:hypothetical protein